MKGDGIPLDEAIPRLADALAYYTEDDIREWFKRYERMTGHQPRVYPSTIEDCRTFRKVPNAPFRKAFVEMSESGKLGRKLLKTTGAHRGTYEPEWVGLFRDELLRLKVGPANTSCTSLTDYLRDKLGLKARKAGNGSIALAWLLEYRVASALCRTLGLRPRDCGI